MGFDSAGVILLTTLGRPSLLIAGDPLILLYSGSLRRRPVPFPISSRALISMLVIACAQPADPGGNGGPEPSFRGPALRSGGAAPFHGRFEPRHFAGGEDLSGNFPK